MDYCNEYDISYNFSAPRTPQQNGVIERKNRTLEKITRIMLIASGLPRNCAEVVNTTCYILNCVLIRPIISKTPYALLKGETEYYLFSCVWM